MTTVCDYRNTTQWIPFMFGPQQLEEITTRFLADQPQLQTELPNPIPTERPSPIKPAPEPKKPPTVSSEYYVYNVKDVLFWLLFIGAHGLAEYDRNEYNCGKRIVEQKQALVQTIFKMPNAQIRKQTGRSLTKLQVADLISSLQTSPRITTDMFPLFAIHYQTDIFVFDRACGTYIVYNYINEDEKAVVNEMPIILYKKGHTFSVELDPQKCIESDDLEKYVKVESVGGSIGPVGNYTKPQLVDIWTKLNKEFKKENMLEKQTKQQLYEQIIHHTTQPR